MLTKELNGLSCLLTSIDWQIDAKLTGWHSSALLLYSNDIFVLVTGNKSTKASMKAFLYI